MSREVFTRVPPGAKESPRPFTLRVSDERLAEFRQLLAQSKIAPPIWENSQPDGRSGVTRQWLAHAKSVWLEQFDWRRYEQQINSFPNFSMNVSGDVAGNECTIHFVALFSARQDATPIMFIHGWPGSFLEFLPMLKLLGNRYTPETLPYHVIVPSLPGFALSARPALERDYTLADAADLLHALMIKLGFDGGYITQGGDLGAFLAPFMAKTYPQCIATHVNLWSPADPQQSAGRPETDDEKLAAQRSKAWRESGNAYAIMHGTRPSTIGLILSSNPLALLSWIGEKLLEWPDPRHPLSLETILGVVSMYWFTSCISTSVWPYRNLLASFPLRSMPQDKPVGYSRFPYEMGYMSESDAKASAKNLVFFESYDKGGHFAALEQPELLLAGVEEFVSRVRKQLA